MWVSPGVGGPDVGWPGCGLARVWVSPGVAGCAYLLGPPIAAPVGAVGGQPHLFAQNLEHRVHVHPRLPTQSLLLHAGSQAVYAFQPHNRAHTFAPLTSFIVVR